MGTAFLRQLQQEFKGYNGQKLAKDLMVGLTVAAVALPLALAFGPAAIIRFPVRPVRWQPFSAR